MKTLTKNANAKINIGLQVLNKRSDNYHNINSIFIPISLCDIITISESIQFELRSNVQFNITDDENLVMKAAKKFNEALGINKAYSIKLQKEIPMQAGLGGGSADAAVVLKMLNEMNGNPFGDEYLAKLAIELGSDVPFFIFNKPAIAKGRGEILEFINFRREINVLVVFPNVNISTKEAYEALKRTQEQVQEIDFYSAFNTGHYNLIINDFEQYAIEKYKEIREIKDILYENGSFFALMSGSGSAVYGMFDSLEDMAIAAEKLDNYKTYFCKTI